MSSEKNEKKLKKGQRPEGWKNNCAKFKEYYATQHPDWTETQCIEAAKKFNKRNNYRSIEYWEYRFPNATHEEHLEMRKQMIDEAKSNHPQNIKYWEKNFPNATHEEHLKMLSESIKNRIDIRPDATGENNPMHHSNTTDLERRQISPKCIEFYEKRFPNATHEEHLKMLSEHLTKNNIIVSDKTKQVKCVEYWLAKGYTKKEAIDIISKSQVTFSLEKCIEKYGLEKGIIIYNNRQNKWLKSFKNSMKNYFVNGIQSSGAANKLFSVIEKQITGQKEFILGKYVFDFVYNNKIIEFNGDYWHANPKIYDKTFINKTNGHTAKEIWKRDKDKIKYAKTHGYDVYTVWESDFKNDYETVIKKCMDFLTQ